MISTFRSTFGEDTGSDGNEFPGDGGDVAGLAVTGTVQVRLVNVFNLRSTTPTTGQWIPRGAVITAVSLDCTIKSVNNAAAETWDIKRYGSLGDDPSPDNAATAFSRCNSGAVTYASTTTYRTTGAKSVSLGANGVTDATDRLQNDATVWGISVRQQNETTGGGADKYTEFYEYVDATAGNRPAISVTWKAVRDPVCGGMCPGVRL